MPARSDYNVLWKSPEGEFNPSINNISFQIIIQCGSNSRSSSKKEEEDDDDDSDEAEDELDCAKSCTFAFAHKIICFVLNKSNDLKSSVLSNFAPLFLPTI